MLHCNRRQVASEIIERFFFHYQFVRQATDGDDKTMHFHRENTDFETNRTHEVNVPHRGGTQATDDPYIGRNAATWAGINVPQPKASDESSRGGNAQRLVRVHQGHKSPPTAHHSRREGAMWSQDLDDVAFRREAFTRTVLWHLGTTAGSNSKSCKLGPQKPKCDD